MLLVYNWPFHKHMTAFKRKQNTGIEFNAKKRITHNPTESNKLLQQMPIFTIYISIYQLLIPLNRVDETRHAYTPIHTYIHSSYLTPRHLEEKKKVIFLYKHATFSHIHTSYCIM